MATIREQRDKLEEIKATLTSIKKIYDSLGAARKQAGFENIVGSETLADLDTLEQKLTSSSRKVAEFQRGLGRGRQGPPIFDLESLNAFQQELAEISKSINEVYSKAGSQKIHFLTPESLEAVRGFESNFKEINNLMGGSSKYANALAVVMGDINKAGAITKEQYVEIATLIQRTAGEARSFAGGAVSEKLVARVGDLIKSTSAESGLMLSQPGIGGGEAWKTPFSAEDVKALQNLTQQMQGETSEVFVKISDSARESFRDLVSNIPVDEIEEKFTAIKRSVGQIVSVNDGAAASAQILKLEMINAAKDIEVTYSAITKLGEATTSRGPLKATLAYETARPTAPTVPTDVTMATGGIMTPAQMQTGDFTKTKILYMQIAEEARNFNKEIQATSVALGDKFSIKAQEASVNVDLLTGKIRISSDYIQQMGDKAQVTGTFVKEMVVGKTGPEKAKIPTMEESVTKLFDPKNIAVFKQNLTEALHAATLKMGDLQGAQIDGASGLIKISARAKEANGVYRNLTLTFDKQGNVVKDLSNRYSDFSKALMQNLTRVSRWAIATTVIYGALNQLQQIPKILAEIDQATARFEAVTGMSFENVNRFFNSTIETAQKFGIDLKQALPAAEFALQAVGGTDQAEAMQLLADSMLLAKVTGGDLRTTIETLSAALNQFNLRQDQGSVIMGKWIAVNREYSVTLADLSKAYAVAGTTAQEVFGGGVDAMDKFNALITIVSKETSLSATQIGTFLKTVFTAYTSDVAIEGLKQYGLEIETASGELRDFNDVMMEAWMVTTQFDAVSSDALTNISKFLTGGGSRQAPLMAASIVSYGDAPGIEETSKNAAEAAAENYAAFVQKLTDNLKDNFQELNLELSKLLKSMGEESIIPFLEKAIDAMTQLVRLLSTINDFAEGAVGQFVSLGLVMVPIFNLLKANKGLNMANMLLQQGGIGKLGDANLGGVIKKLIPTGLGASQSALLGLGAGLVDGIMDGMSASENKFRTGAISFITTGLLGAAGASVLGPIGAILGIQLAQAIQKGLEKGLAQQDFATTLRESSMGVDLGREGLTEEIFEKVGSDEQDLAAFAMQLADFTTTGNLTQILARRLTEAGSREEFVSSDVGNLAYDYYQVLIGAVKAEQNTAAEVIAEETAETLLLSYGLARREIIKQQFAGVGEAISPELATQKERTRREAFARLLEGDIGTSEYKKIEERLEISTDPAIMAWDALGDVFRKSNESFYDVFETLADAPEELTSLFKDLTLQVSSYKDKLEAANATGESTIEIERKLLQIKEEATDVYAALEARKLEERGFRELPSFTNVGETPREDVEQGIAMGRRLQRSYAEMIFRGNEAEFRAAGIETFAAYYEGILENIPMMQILGDNILMQLEGLIPGMFQLGLESAKEMSAGMDEGFNVRRLKDVDPSQMAEIEAGNRYWTNYLARARGQTTEQYIQEEGIDMSLILGENNVFNKILTTNEAMNFVLEDILDTEKKQLEGMWNIPEGATFWVPLTSAFYSKGEGGGYPDLPPIQDTRVKKGVVDPAEEMIKKWDIPDAEPILRAFKDITQADYELAGIGRRRERPEEAVPGWMDVGARFGRTGRKVSKDWMDVGAGFAQREKVGPDLQTADLLSSIITSFETMTPPAMAIEVNVPEPKEIKVESYLTANLYIDRTKIATVIKQVLSREFSRVTSTRRYTVPGRAV